MFKNLIFVEILHATQYFIFSWHKFNSSNMKSLASYIINENAKLEREINRDYENISAPYLLEEFKKWLPLVVKSPKTVTNYVSSINSLDQLIVPFDINEDFYLQLQRSFENKEFDKIPVLLENYDKEIQDWHEWAKTADDYDTQPKHISDMRSAFQKYSTFIQMKVSEAKGTKPTIITTSAKDMFLRNDFIQWLVDTGRCSKNSASSVASRVKTLNDKFISRLVSEKNYDFLILLPNHIKKDAEKTILLLDILEMRVYDSEVNPEDYSIKASTFRYMKKAFSQYVSFIKEIIYNNYLTSDNDNENKTEKSESETELYDNKVNKICFDKNYIKNNFSLRLLTQDRLSNNKNIFYPIRLIRRILTKHDMLTRHGLIDGEANEMKCLFNIIYNCIDKINVITDKGIFKLKEVKTLEIDLKQKSVTAVLNNKEKAMLLTKTDKGDTEKMKVSTFKDISIDHVVSMADILEEKTNKLPALSKLTEMIKRIAKENSINITPGNVSLLNSKFIENIKFSEIKPLLPKIKEELAIIDEVTELQLMEKTYNIRKK